MRGTRTLFAMAGSISWLVALYLIYSGFVYETFIIIPTGTQGSGAAAVAGMDQMQMRLLYCALGVGGAIVGTLLLGFAALIGAIDRSKA